MFKQVIIRGIGVMLLAGVVMLGCSGDEESGELSAVRRVVDTVATKVAENVVEASFASAKAGEN